MRMRFTDIHCHIIPGVDDGPRDIEESISLARRAVDDGIAAIVATPHVIEGVYSGADRESRVADLRAALEGEGIYIDIFTGAEVSMSMCLGGDAEILSGLTLAGSRYLLMETAETTYDQIAMAAHRVRLCGLYPILAHPERVGFVQENPEKLREIMAPGEVFCQLTGASVDGRLGRGASRTSHALLRLGLAHLVATDAHSANRRAPELARSYATIKGVAGEEAARALTMINPGNVLKNAPLSSIHVQGRRERSLFSGLFRKR